MDALLLVSCGAIVGVNIRYIIYKELHKNKFNKGFIFLLINSLSSFLLGLFSSISLNNNSFFDSTQFGLFFSIGFLGSLSTFSTFMYDLFELSYQFKFYRALKLCIFSLSLGLLSLTFGYFLGNQ